jgi:RNA polymerase sigma-B factor
MRKLLGRLQKRERQIIYLRFFDDLTQSEIADQIGVSQVHVSRLLRSTLDALRQQLELPHGTQRRPHCQPMTAAAGY